MFSIVTCSPTLIVYCNIIFNHAYKQLTCIPSLSGHISAIYGICTSKLSQLLLHQYVLNQVAQILCPPTKHLNFHFIPLVVGDFQNDSAIHSMHSRLYAIDMYTRHHRTMHYIYTVDAYGSHYFHIISCSLPRNKNEHAVNVKLCLQAKTSNKCLISSHGQPTGW